MGSTFANGRRLRIGVSSWPLLIRLKSSVVCSSSAGSLVLGRPYHAVDVLLFLASGVCSENQRRRLQNKCLQRIAVWTILDCVRCLRSDCDALKIAPRIMRTPQL